jgi:hypothetical protein
MAHLAFWTNFKPSYVCCGNFQISYLGELIWHSCQFIYWAPWIITHLTAFHIIDMLYPGFLLRILWSSQSGHHSQNSLAKLGYILDMKVGKQKNPSIWLDLYCNLFLKVWWFETNPFEIRLIRGIFFHEKSFRVEIILWKKHSCWGLS